MTQTADISNTHSLRPKRLGIETLNEAHVFLRRDSPVSRAEGFSAHTRVRISKVDRSIVATLYYLTGDMLLPDEIGLSELAWQQLNICEGDRLQIEHAPPVDSLRYLRSKVYGHDLAAQGFDAILKDVAHGEYSNIHLAAFITACAARPLKIEEIHSLTEAMIKVGDRLQWAKSPIADKHSIGGLPGNRTTPIVVAIAAACGITIPKTSSRAITSPAGTADMMETLAPVNLDVQAMRRVVEREGGCIVWGGAVRLSPTDDILIRIERVLDLDAEGQLVASILSKKIAAGATHLVLDVPVGPTAKVRSHESAHALSQTLTDVAASFGLKTHVVLSDGLQPIGRGIGPALEARDVLAVLQGKPTAPEDLKEHALLLAGSLLELAGSVSRIKGATLAKSVLESGKAWEKFQRICEAQGGMREPPTASHFKPILACNTGIVDRIDNRRLAQIAKLAGAPDDKAAGLDLHVRIGERVMENQPLYTVHAQSSGELEYALEFAKCGADIIGVERA
jgi:thymidine phosphorylase